MRGLAFVAAGCFVGDSQKFFHAGHLHAGSSLPCISAASVGHEANQNLPVTAGTKIAFPAAAAVTSLGIAENWPFAFR
jgi:hypothetical protein